jgi:hypothetical protein
MRDLPLFIKQGSETFYGGLGFIPGTKINSDKETHWGKLS